MTKDDDNTPNTSPSDQPAPKMHAGRKDRLAQQLRANLNKRKAQSRQRRENATDED